MPSVHQESNYVSEEKAKKGSELPRPAVEPPRAQKQSYTPAAGNPMPSIPRSQIKQASPSTVYTPAVHEDLPPLWQQIKHRPHSGITETIIMPSTDV